MSAQNIKAKPVGSAELRSIPIQNMTSGGTAAQAAGGATGASQDGALRAALLGNPNCGKTALFNLLTGARQKVANYAGVTVERKEGWLTTPAKRRVRLLDLPGTYSLDAHSADERITHGSGSARALRY